MRRATAWGSLYSDRSMRTRADSPVEERLGDGAGGFRLAHAGRAEQEKRRQRPVTAKSRVAPPQRRCDSNAGLVVPYHPIVQAIHPRLRNDRRHHAEVGLAGTAAASATTRPRRIRRPCSGRDGAARAAAISAMPGREPGMGFVRWIARRHAHQGSAHLGRKPDPVASRHGFQAGFHDFQ